MKSFQTVTLDAHRNSRPVPLERDSVPSYKTTADSRTWRRRSQRAFQQTTDLLEKLRAQNVAFEAIGTLSLEHPRENYRVAETG
jgi:hypothetical protein